MKCVMVGYADMHSGDTYRLYKPEENSVILSRDDGSSISVAVELRMFATDMDVDLKDDQIGEDEGMKPVEIPDVAAEAGRKVVEEAVPMVEDAPATTLST